MNERFALALDVGGTSLKSAIVSEQGRILPGSVLRTPIDSNGSAEAVLKTFAAPLAQAQEQARRESLPLAGIGIGMPGPFEYENGVSRIRGVGKYEAIYGMNVREELRRRLGLPGGFPIFFEVDAWAFVRGEAWQGAGKGLRRIIGITLGTGMGSGFMADGEMKDSGPGVPPLAWIGGLEYGSGILDDRVSRRGIIARYRELSGERRENLDVKDICRRAQAEDARARKVLAETGAILGRAVRPSAEAFEADWVIIGGQISKSYPLLAAALHKELGRVPSLKKIAAAEDADHSALLGAGRFLFLRLGCTPDPLHAHGNIFTDDFGKDSAARWLDMKEWGLGVWQIKDGALVSMDPARPEQQLYAAAPKLDNAILNRDFSLLLRFKPVRGSNYQLSLNIRQEGLSRYAVEISKDGGICIKKSVLGRGEETLSSSRPGLMAFNVRQWLRLDVRGAKPVSLRVKLWPDRGHEPEFYAAAALDRNPLKPENMAVTVNMLQDGGAHTAIDSFDIHSKIPASPLWRWIKGKDASPERVRLLEQAEEKFRGGDLYAAETSLRNLLKETTDRPACLNNLAAVRAERDAFDAAWPWAQKAWRLAPDDPAVSHNLKWIWHGLVSEGMAPPGEDSSFAELSIRTDRKTCFDHRPIKLRIGLFHSLFGLPPQSLKARISLRDASGSEIRGVDRTWTPPDSAGAIFEENLERERLPDGAYLACVQVRDARGQERRAECGFEVVVSGYQALARRHAALLAQIAALAGNEDRANLEAELLPAEKSLRAHDQPGVFLASRASIEASLAKAQERLSTLKQGARPYHHQAGTFLRGYRSQIDDSVQGYGLFVPNEYTAGKPHPLIINLHGYDPSFSGWQDNPFLPVFMPPATKNGRYIVASPFGRGNAFYEDMGEQDVLQVLREVQRLYSIDPDRIYLTGGSMGGWGAWNIGLRCPDMFAALAPVMGPTEFGFWTGPEPRWPCALRRFILDKHGALALAENSLNLPLFCNHGALDDIVPVAQSRKMVERLKRSGKDIRYVEHPQAKHGGFPPEMDHAIFDWFEGLRRDPQPRRVRFKTSDLKHGGAYWVKIESFLDPLDFASLEAEVAHPNKILVRTQNVGRFRLALPEPLILAKDALTVRIDGREYHPRVPENRELAFVAARSKSGRRLPWSAAKALVVEGRVKKACLSGPIRDAMNAGFILVYGSSGSAQEAAVNRQEAQNCRSQWESWQHVACRMKRDRDVTADDMERCNIILFGGPDSNAIVRKINARLPIRFGRGSVIAGKRRFAGEQVGLAMIYPNPLNENRYAVIQAGVSWQGTLDITRRLGSEFDYIVFDERTLGLPRPQGNLTVDGTPLLCGFFDQHWRLAESCQRPADPKTRKNILPRKLPAQSMATMGGLELYLSDMPPASMEQAAGTPQSDRTFWGSPFRARSKTYAKGLGVFPHSKLVYRARGRWKYFSAVLTADMNPHVGMRRKDYKGGKLQFGIYGDGHELFVSNAMDVHSPPQEISVPIEGIDALALVVRTQDWLPAFAQGASWVDAKLTR